MKKTDTKYSSFPLLTKQDLKSINKNNNLPLTQKLKTPKTSKTSKTPKTSKISKSHKPPKKKGKKQKPQIEPQTDPLSKILSLEKSNRSANDRPPQTLWKTQSSADIFQQSLGGDLDNRLFEEIAQKDVATFDFGGNCAFLVGLKVSPEAAREIVLSCRKSRPKRDSAFAARRSASRYFSQKSAIVERDRAFRRLKPELSELSEFAKMPKFSFCENFVSFGSDERGLVSESFNEAIQRRGKALSSLSLAEPLAPSCWLDLVEFQDEGLLDSRQLRKFSAERKMAILERALESCPHSEDLLWLYLQLAERCWAREKVSLLWRMVVERNAFSWRLAKRAIDFHAESAGFDCPLFVCRRTFSTFLSLISGLISGQKVDLSLGESTAGFLISQRILFEKNAGKGVLAIALLQSVLDFHLMPYEGTFSEKIEHFELFWESEFPRVGLPRSKEPWKIGKKCAENVDFGENAAFYRSVSGGNSSFSSVSFDEIRDVLFAFSEETHLIYIVERFLICFGLLKPSDLLDMAQSPSSIAFLSSFRKDSPLFSKLKALAAEAPQNSQKGALKNFVLKLFGELSTNLPNNRRLQSLCLDSLLFLRETKAARRLIRQSLKKRPKDLHLWSLSTRLEMGADVQKGIAFFKKASDFLKTSPKGDGEMLAPFYWDFFRCIIHRISSAFTRFAPQLKSILLLDSNVQFHLNSVDSTKNTKSNFHSAQILRRLKKLDSLLVDSARFSYPPEASPNFSFLYIFFLSLLSSGPSKALAVFRRFQTVCGEKTAEQLAPVLERFCAQRIGLGAFFLGVMASLIARFPSNIKVAKRIFSAQLKQRQFASKQLLASSAAKWRRTSPQRVALVFLSVLFSLDSMPLGGFLESQICTVRNCFEELLSITSAGVNSPSFWGLYFYFEVLVNEETLFYQNRVLPKLKLGQVRDIRHQSNSNAFRVFLRAIKKCPTAESLWKEGAFHLQQEMDEFEYNGLFELMKQVPFF